MARTSMVRRVHRAAQIAMAILDGGPSGKTARAYLPYLLEDIIGECQGQMLRRADRGGAEFAGEEVEEGDDRFTLGWIDSFREARKGRQRVVAQFTEGLRRMPKERHGLMEVVLSYESSRRSATTRHGRRTTGPA